MGPPEFTGGNRRWIGIDIHPLAMLQWGRRNSPAETLDDAGFDSDVLAASMGPPEFTGGNWLGCSATC